MTLLTKPEVSSAGFARAMLENMVAAHGELMRLGVGVDAAAAVDSVLPDVMDALAWLPLERLRSQSDFILHAEGPGGMKDMPWLSAMAWLLTIADSNMRKLSAAALDLWGAQGEALARDLDLRVPGVVSGSIWVGVKVLGPPEDLLPEDTGLIARLTQHLAALPDLTRHIGDESIDPAVAEVAPDPAMRDVQLAALLRFAPTGKKGIHTLQIGSGHDAPASLSQRERVVLRQALARPDRSRSMEGRFTGEVRAADLDRTRIHLRNVPSIGTVRCVMPELSAAEGRKLLGRTVTVEGRYQADSQGRPRLVFVERVRSKSQPRQQPLE